MTRDSKNPRRVSRLAPLLLGLAAWAVLPAAAGPSELPEHARVSRYGSGWDCTSGFRRVGDTCVRIVVPAQGFLSRSGDSWECERGFRKDDAACVAVPLPANARLDYSGNNWTCDEGFHAHAARCVAD